MMQTVQLSIGDSVYAATGSGRPFPFLAPGMSNPSIAPILRGIARWLG